MGMEKKHHLGTVSIHSCARPPSRVSGGEGPPQPECQDCPLRLILKSVIITDKDAGDHGSWKRKKRLVFLRDWALPRRVPPLLCSWTACTWRDTSSRWSCESRCGPLTSNSFTPHHTHLAISSLFPVRRPLDASVWIIDLSRELQAFEAFEVPH